MLYAIYIVGVLIALGVWTAIALIDDNSDSGST